MFILQNCTFGNAVCATYICDINSMSISDNVIISIDAQIHLDTLRHYQVTCSRCSHEIVYLLLSSRTELRMLASETCHSFHASASPTWPLWQKHHLVSSVGRALDSKPVGYWFKFHRGNFLFQKMYCYHFGKSFIPTLCTLPTLCCLWGKNQSSLDNLTLKTLRKKRSKMKSKESVSECSQLQHHKLHSG